MKRIVFLLGSLLTIVLMFSCKPESDDKIPIEILESNGSWAWNHRMFPTYDSTSKYFLQSSVLVFKSEEELIPYWDRRDTLKELPVLDFQKYSILGVHVYASGRCTSIELRQVAPIVYRFDIVIELSPFEIDPFIGTKTIKVPSYIPKDAEFEMYFQIRKEII